MDRNLREKIIMITGATSGLGLETARALARHGAQLVLVGRSRERVIRIVEDIRRETGNEKIDFLIADLASQAQVRASAGEFLAKYRRLDVLINNAGAAFAKREVSADGLEMTLALNHLGYFLLTNLLLNILKQSAPSRIINVASAAHLGGKVDFDNLNAEQGYSMMGVYNTSKLENLYFTYELARRIEGSGVTVNAVHPGLVNSNFAKQSKGTGVYLFNLLQRQFGKTPAEGAKTIVYLALSDEVQGVTGQYFANERRTTSSMLSRNPNIAHQLWAVSEKLTGLSQRNC